MIASPAELYNAFERILENRWSCRSFLPSPVPIETIKKIARTAQRTASWNNMQPWNVTITTGQGTERFRTRMMEVAGSQIGLGEDATKLGRSQADFAFPREYPEPFLGRRRASGFQLYRAVGINRGDRAAYGRQSLENFRFFGAPHVAIISTDEALGTYGAVDCGGYVTNFMSAAGALGVASVSQAALAIYSVEIRRFFGLAESQRVVCGISFGYPDHQHPLNGYRTAREPIEAVVRFVND